MSFFIFDLRLAKTGLTRSLSSYQMKGWLGPASQALFGMAPTTELFCFHRLYFIVCVILNQGWVGLVPSNYCMPTTKV